MKCYKVRVLTRAVFPNYREVLKKLTNTKLNSVT